MKAAEVHLARIVRAGHVGLGIVIGGARVGAAEAFVDAAAVALDIGQRVVGTPWPVELAGQHATWPAADPTQLCFHIVRTSLIVLTSYS